MISHYENKTVYLRKYIHLLVDHKPVRYTDYHGTELLTSKEGGQKATKKTNVTNRTADFTAWTCFTFPSQSDKNISPLVPASASAPPQHTDDLFPPKIFAQKSLDKSDNDRE